jgi:hypothetical protein
MWQIQNGPNLSIFVLIGGGDTMDWLDKPLKYFPAVDRLAKAIGERAGFDVEIKLQQGAGLGFWACGKKFAQVNPEKSWSVVYTGVKKEWALKAQVADSAEGERKKGWHNTDDELYWLCGVSDDNGLRGTASILARVCIVRLQ